MRKHRGSLLSPLVAAMAGAVLTITITLYSRAAAQDSWPVALLAFMPAWVWILLPAALLAWALSVRDWAAAVVNTCTLVPAAIVLGGLCWATGSDAPPPGESTTIRIVSWNIFGRLDEERMPDVVRAVQDCKPDILCLQEAYAKSYAGLLPGFYRDRVNEFRIYSRYPILDCRRLELAPDAPKGALCATVRTPGGDLSVHCVHFRGSLSGSQDSLPPLAELPDYLLDGMRLRREQTAGLLSSLPDHGPAVICGDFNLPPTASPYRQVSARLTDAFAATRFGFGLTYTINNWLPAWRIDYIWCASGVRPQRAWVGPMGISDHRPIIAEVLVHSGGRSGE